VRIRFGVDYCGKFFLLKVLDDSQDEMYELDEMYEFMEFGDKALYGLVYEGDFYTFSKGDSDPELEWGISNMKTLSLCKEAKG